MNNSKAYNNHTNWILPVVFMVVIMCSFSGHSQSQTGSVIEISGNGTVTSEKAESSRAASNLEFAQWFMGTKQDPNSTIDTEGTNAKKSIITSGIAPNRLLIKAFLKKVVNYETAVS
ncbi:hypothetical protein [Flavobacterium daejeonense]|uniref:hypothetical protein n=1 Tax=Flavobacterium daejeonense TaxID=350893 RepID=UPI000479EBE2|nr:hypothetical protein [Flavobacterium daejeonense]